MDSVTLPRELERFATEAVAVGHYCDVGEVVAAGVSLLQRTQAQRAKLLASVIAAEAKGERNGFLTIGDVMRDADTLIEELASTVR